MVLNTFNKTYFLWFLFLLAIEICIALFINSGFIRHTFGDVLVVILLYCFLKSFLDFKPVIVVIVVLLISFLIEFLQLTHFLEWFGLENNQIAKVVFGNTFHFLDLIAYTVGVTIVLLIEYDYLSYKPNN